MEDSYQQTQHEHHHSHYHEHSNAPHVHHSQRAGHNRTTSSQRKRTIISNILFSFLCVVAALFLLVVLYDRWFGLF